MSFNASQVIVAGPAVNNVSRDQVNFTARDVYLSSLAEPTEYDEFKRVTTGDMYLLEEVHRDGILGCRCPSCRTQRTIYSVVLPERKIKCTAIEYKGPEAQELWEKDFRRFSQNRSPDAWQLYALNRSKVPFLIFHDKLVPLAHFYKKSFWGNMFVYRLRKKLDCNFKQIWLNTRGTLIKGPEGPWVPVEYAGEPDGITIPPSAKMLQDDISFQFFQKFPSTTMDCLIVLSAQRDDSSSPLNLFDEKALYIPPENPPEILDGHRFDTVYSPSLGAVARWRDGGALWKTDKEGLVDKTVLDDGLIRLKLDGPDVDARFHFEWLSFQKSWMSQSSRIIDGCGMSGTEEQCFIVDPPDLILESTFLSSLNQQRLLPLETPPPIYLFIYPFPMTLAEIKSWRKSRTHFWSLDENGQSEMTKEECRRWGVPELNAHVESFDEPKVYAWPSHVYTAIRNWQVARGFDPTTADFARSLISRVRYPHR